MKSQRHLHILLALVIIVGAASLPATAGEPAITTHPNSTAGWNKSTSNPIVDPPGTNGWDMEVIKDDGVHYSIAPKNGSDFNTENKKALAIWTATDPEGDWTYQGEALNVSNLSVNATVNPGAVPDGEGGWYIYWNDQTGSNDAGNDLYWNHTTQMNTTWERGGHTGISSAELDGNDLNEPGVIRETNPANKSRRYKMLITDNKLKSNVYAYSANGENWTVHGVVESKAYNGDGIVNPDVVMVNETYISYHVSAGTTQGIGVQYSNDFINWTDGVEALSNRGGHSFDDANIHGPDTVIDTDGTSYLFYGGENDSGEIRQGVAVGNFHLPPGTITMNRMTTQTDDHPYAESCSRPQFPILQHLTIHFKDHTVPFRFLFPC